MRLDAAVAQSIAAAEEVAAAQAQKLNNSRMVFRWCRDNVRGCNFQVVHILACKSAVWTLLDALASFTESPAMWL